MRDVDEGEAHALRLFGGQLKHWRGLLGWTQEEFGRRVGYSADTVASIEQGRRVPRGRFFARADEVLNAHGAVLAAEAYLSVVAKRPVLTTELTEVEREAVCLDFFDAMALPAVLHTEAYARAVLGAFSPPDDERLAAHLERAGVLDRTPPARIGFVIDESALRRPLGGRTVLAEQLTRIAHLARRGSVTVQVLPLDCEDHAGLSGSLALVETTGWRHVAHHGHDGRETWVTTPAEVSRLRQRYGLLRAQALTTRDSLDLIEKRAADAG